MTKGLSKLQKMAFRHYFFKTKTRLFLATFLLWAFTAGKGYAFSTQKHTYEIEDHVIVVKNNSVIFDLLQTEEAVESPVSIRVIEQPKFGELTLNEDQSFEYAPLQNLCEKDDLIIYEMTKDGIMTEVTVHIEILCESLTIMSGISKSKEANQSALETFKILGVQNYPNNTLYIFDDIGNQVFQQKNYNNEWEGILEDQEQMETHRMYYYVFNDGGGNFYSGYLHIN